MKVILSISISILIIASFYINWQAAGLMFLAWFIDNVRNLP